MDRLIDRLPQSLRGPAWMILASLAFSGMWTLIRVTSHDLHPFVVTFWRNMFGTLALLPFLIRHSALMTASHPRRHLKRATSGFIGTFATFFAIANAPLAIVQSIYFAAPLFATVVAALFLGERIRAHRIAALAVGFIGILVVLRPGFQPMSLGIVAAIVAAVFTAGSFLAIKQLVGKDDSRVVAAYSFLLMLVPSAGVAAFQWQWPRGITWLWLALLGLLAVIGQSSMTRAFSAADATAVMPFDFVRFAIIVAVGWWGFGETVDALTLIGGAVILGSTCYLVYREAAVGRSLKPASQPPLD